MIIGLGVIQLLRSKKSGNRRPGSASAGMNLLDLVLKPGSEHRLIEQEEQKMRVQPSEDGAPPFQNLGSMEKRLTGLNRRKIKRIFEVR